jgi:hypothetical protein
MEDYFKNSKYKISEFDQEQDDALDEEQSTLFQHEVEVVSPVKFFDLHPKQILEDGSKIFNHRVYVGDLGTGSFSQTYCLSEVRSEEDLRITEETKSVQTFENESSAPKDKRVALRVYNTVVLAN